MAYVLLTFLPCTNSIEAGATVSASRSSSFHRLNRRIKMGLPNMKLKRGNPSPAIVIILIANLILFSFANSALAGEQAPPENRSYGFFMTFTDEQLEAMPVVNASWVRMAGVAVWNTVEVQPGSGIYDFSLCDPVIQEADALNLSLLLTINPVHQLDAGASQKALPTNLSAYKAFVAAFVERYDGDGIDDAPGSPVVRYWQIGNEPDNVTANGEGIEWKDTPQNFAIFVKETAEAIRDSDPSAKIVLGGLARGRSGLADFFEPMLTALDGFGGGPYFDIFDIHWFGLASTNDYLGISTAVDEVNNTLSTHGYGQVPLWATEVATYSGTPQGYATQSEADQARDLAKRMLYCHQLGIEKVFWEIYREFHNFKDVANGYFDNTGIVNNPLNDGDSSKKKSYYTYKLLAEKLDGAVVQHGSQFMQEVQASVLEGCEFTNFGRTYYAIWNDNPALVGTLVSLPTTCQQFTVYHLVPDGNNAIPTETVPAVNGNFEFTLSLDPILLEYEGDGPALQITSPSNGLLVKSGTLSVAGVTDPSQSVKLEGPFGATPQTTTADSAGNFSFSSVALAEGNNALTVTSGPGENTRSVTCRVVLDTIAPAISVTYPEQGAVLNTPTIALEGTTDMGQDVTFENPPSGTPLIATGNIVNNSLIFPEETFPEGLNTVTLSATDDAGNSAVCSSEFTIDTALPAISNITAWQNTSETGPYTVEATITDNSALFYCTLAYTINGGALIEIPMASTGANRWRAQIPGQPAETNITYFIKARDIAGNLATNPSSSTPLSFRVVAPPVELITATPAATAIKRGGTLNVSGTVRNPYMVSMTANVKIVVTLPNKSEMTLMDVNVPVGAGSTRTQPLAHVIPKTAPTGTYTYSAIALDVTGLELDRDSFTFTVNP